MQSRCKFSGDRATRTRLIQGTWVLADGGGGAGNPPAGGLSPDNTYGISALWK